MSWAEARSYIGTCAAVASSIWEFSLVRGAQRPARTGSQPTLLASRAEVNAWRPSRPAPASPVADQQQVAPHRRADRIPHGAVDA